ncbi:ThiF family adenylyltransferase [Agrobacterium cavarae]|uniref:ThiF family adenylyltransferase n=1 Tax=Agrobacterium cavarae TaxID=2528239 RepID=UPI002FDB0BE9
MNDNLTLSQRRQVGHLDNAVVPNAHGLFIGAGRAIGKLEWLASTGIRHFTIIDPGTVEAENIGQSGYTIEDLGRSKVEAAERHIRLFCPGAEISAIAAKHSDVPNLRDLMRKADFVCDGADDLAVAANLAAHACAVGADVVHIRTTELSDQFIIAGTLKRSGAPGCVRCRLKSAFDALEIGFEPAPFYPSFRLVPERLNLYAAWIMLGLIHARNDQSISLGIEEIGRHFLKHPAWVGLNSVHSSGEIFPIKQYREPRSSGWTCPVCGTRAEDLDLEGA